MSLKYFHLFFITLATLLLGGFAWWCFEHGLPAPLAWGCVAGTIALPIYGVSFWKKAKKIYVCLAAALLPATSQACSTCGIDPASHLAQAAEGVLWILLGCLAAMFAATGAFAYYLWHRANTPVPPHIQLAEEIGAQFDSEA